MHFIKKRKIRAICLGVCLTVAAVLNMNRKVWAAEKVDMTQRGNLVLSLATEDSAQMGQDMSRIQEPIPVYAWKLADMLETGKYRFTGEFADLAPEGELTGESFKELTQEALSRIYGLEEGSGEETEEDAGFVIPEGEPGMTPDRRGSIRVTEDGSRTETEGFDDMDLGLYLVVTGNARSPKYEYSFNPMIVSLPWCESQYLGEGDNQAGSGDGTQGSDQWQYARTAVMKPARAPLYGNIKIIKSLTSYNAAQGDVTFVFDITAREGEEIVYSNVVSATFSSVGTQEILVEHIPAEALVTVTEIYSGANCEITAAEEGSKAVLAEMEDGSGEPVSFRFENAYNEEGKKGYGIENRFRYNTSLNPPAYEWSTNRPAMGTGDGGNEEGNRE